jgi:hypothetical protein
MQRLLQTCSTSSHTLPSEHSFDPEHVRPCPAPEKQWNNWCFGWEPTEVPIQIPKLIVKYRQTCLKWSPVGNKSVHITLQIESNHRLILRWLFKATFSQFLYTVRPCLPFVFKRTRAIYLFICLSCLPLLPVCCLAAACLSIHPSIPLRVEQSIEPFLHGYWVGHIAHTHT